MQLRMAVLRVLEVLGEAFARMGTDLRTQYPDIPWSLAISMRNRLIHAYFDVNLDVVWITVTRDLPLLLPKLKSILHENSDCRN